MNRSDQSPSSSIPIAYFACAHAALAAAAIVLALHPGLPGGFFYHPKMIALVHVVTLAWLSGSILGAFHIVGPLVLRLPMPVRWPDWAALVAFELGTSGMVSHFWIGEYDGMVWSSSLVVAGLCRVAVRAWIGLGDAPVSPPVKLHVLLAFCNVLVAAALGIVIGINRTHGFLAVSTIAGAYAHAHLAAIGWVTMMVVGLAYRLIPMMVPAAMPPDARLSRSAWLIEGGVLIVAVSLLRGEAWLIAGALAVAAGLGSFFREVGRAVKRRKPRPPALPRRDWSTWQTHAALAWLLVAVGLGLALSVGVRAEWTIIIMWLYGVAGLLGFLAQIVTGIQGRLVPMYAWYRARDRRGGAQPIRGANELPSARLAFWTFAAWNAAVPLLGWGLARDRRAMISAGAALLALAVLTSAAHLGRVLRQAAGDR